MKIQPKVGGEVYWSDGYGVKYKGKIIKIYRDEFNDLIIDVNRILCGTTHINCSCNDNVFFCAKEFMEHYTKQYKKTCEYRIGQLAEIVGL